MAVHGAVSFCSKFYPVCSHIYLHDLQLFNVDYDKQNNLVNDAWLRLIQLRRSVILRQTGKIVAIISYIHIVIVSENTCEVREIRVMLGP